MTVDVRDAREPYPPTDEWVYLNTAAVGLASRRVAPVERLVHALDEAVAVMK